MFNATFCIILSINLRNIIKPSGGNRYRPSIKKLRKKLTMSEEILNLNDILSVGQNAIARRVVQHEDAADNYYNDFKNLLATPRLIHWAIDASIEAIDPYLPEEYASIGLSINFVHTAPSSLGMTVTVHASIIAITEKDVTLSIKAWDEQGEIGHGLLKRSIVLKKAVLDKAEERTRLLLIRQSNEQMKGMER